MGRIQTNARNAGRSDLISTGIQATISPSASLVTQAANGTSDFFAGMASGARLRAENARLKQLEQISNLYSERLKFLTNEISSVRQLLDLPAVPGKRMIPALVMSYSTLESRITINRGRNHGIKPQLPVLAGEGLVGVVQTSDANTSQVLLISSPQIRVGAVVNLQQGQFGILRGESANKLTMEIMGKKGGVKLNDVVLTSGLGELIPGGVPIGVVAQIEEDSEYGTTRCQVFPYVQIGDIREVVVLR